jgi:hypothetical protein
MPNDVSFFKRLDCLEQRSWMNLRFPVHRSVFSQPLAASDQSDRKRNYAILA